jgi:hypothetical protein
MGCGRPWAKSDVACPGGIYAVSRKKSARIPTVSGVGR